MLKAVFKREFNIRSLGFSHDRPEEFVRSQWQKTAGISIVYLVYRCMFAIFFLSVSIWSFCSAAAQNTPTESFLSKWPIYLTNWGYTLCTVQALFAAGIVLHQLYKEKTTGFVEGHAQMPMLYKVYWLLHTVAAVASIGITGSYFVVDYDPAVDTLTALNLLSHAFNSIFMVLDIIIVSHPFRLLHFCWSLIFIVIYFTFTVIYYFAGGTGKNHSPSIYGALDWRKPQTTIPIAILGMLAVLLAHFGLWLVVIVRKKISGYEEEDSDELKISKKSSSNRVQPMDIVAP